MTDRHEPQTRPVELGLLAEAMRSRQAPDRVEQALLKEFRARRRAVKPVRRWRRSWVLAPVAVTVVLAALVLRPAPEAPAPVASASEMTTDYIPIGIANPLFPDEFAQVVRISIPRSEMVGFGVPIEFPAGGNRVMADVVIGEDGVARAIRFVE